MDQPPPLPEDYRIKVIKGILEMCSRDMYANINDFDWYIDVLVQLVRVSPSASSALLDDDMPESDGTSMGDKDDVSFEIGRELQNVAVRVKAVRPEATEAAQSLVLVDRREQMFPSSGNGGQGFELNPVALGAQKKVPIPDELDLDTPINADLPNVLRKADYDSYMEPDEDDVYQFYNQRAAAYVPPSEAAADRLDLPEAEPKSYQASAEEEYLDPDIVARRKAERRARNKDDPFYIPTDNESGRSTPLHNLLKTNNGDDLDIDSIPIMDLDLETRERLGGEQRSRSDQSVPQQRRKVRKNFEILVDENLGPDEGGQASDSSRPELARPTQTKGKKSLLEVDSTGLAALSLEETGNSKLDMERREAEEAEMAKALKEVERLRLEMQRASERIQAKDVPPEGQLVKRKKKKAKKEVKGEPAAAPAAEESQKAAGEGEGEGAATAVKKKKKKAKKQEDGAAAEGAGGDDGAAPEARPKKKKKRRPVLLDDAEGGAEASVG
ncbi:Clathrin/coatomer adaptor adaptin-like protein [Neofusicoccum parvum]|nr:Clathrin/coatomer adaptor adaptin-like protein [Neofusicoccum parvum]